MRARWGNVARGEGRRTVVTMRLAPVVAVAGTLLLSACGSGGSTAESPAPVESVAAAGAVAAATPQCAEGPPASGNLLNGVTGSPAHDGVVGAIYNKTGRDIYITHLDKALPLDNGYGDGHTGGEWCKIPVGGRAAYAWSSGSEKKLVIVRDRIVRTTINARWWDWNPYGGIVVTAVDPSAGYPKVIVSGMQLWMGKGDTRKYPKERDYEKQEKSLSEDESANFKSSWGTVDVTRLEDNSQASREWTGANTWAVNDWARIDISVTALCECDVR